MNSNPTLHDERMKRQVRPFLRRFHASMEEIQASAVISGDGLPIASVLDDGVDPDRFGAMCASLLALATQAAKEVSRGDLRQLLIGGSEGSMLLVQAGSRGVLAVATSPAANLGRVFLEARKAAGGLAELLDTPLH